MLKILGAVSILALSLAEVFSIPAQAKVTYTFTSSEGDFTYVSDSFFEYGGLNLSDLASSSFPAADNITRVSFHNAAFSDIQLISPACALDDTCFNPVFGRGDIFLTPGTYTDPASGAQLVISGSPVPEPATWAMILLGFGGLGFAGYLRGRGWPEPLDSRDSAPSRQIFQM